MMKVNLDTESAQIPKMGMSRLMAHCNDLIVSLHWEGSPGPFEQKRPSHCKFALRGDVVTASTRVTWDTVSKRVRLQVVVERHDDERHVVRLHEVAHDVVLHACEESTPLRNRRGSLTRLIDSCGRVDGVVAVS